MRAPIQNPDPLARSQAAPIAEGAAGLYDRLAAQGAGRGNGPAPASDVLEPWMRAFSPESPEALIRRLGWDGLDPDAVRRAIAEPIAPAPLPTWTAWLPRFADEARRLAGDEGGAAVEEASLPFVELWLPVVRAARAELLGRMGHRVEVLAPAALAVMERQLLREVATIAGLAAFERFRARLEQESGSPVGDESSRIVYTAFTREALEDGLTALLTEYPVVARLLAVLAETWTEATGELVVRLLADQSVLSETFAGGAPLGPVESVESGLGDRHHGGRRVMVLAFAGGRRLVYKPRDLGLEAAYHRFLGWASSEGLDVPPPLRVLEREGYGWVEFAAQGRFEDLEDVRQYYRRAGALMCLAYVLRGRDLHMENVVASADGPQLVDTEMLVQPESAGVGVLPGSRDARAAADTGRPSCLETGLLSMFQRDPEGGMFDIGGLRGAGSGRAPVARRVWRALGTDGLHFVLDGRFEPTARNAVRLGDADQRPEDFAEEMVSGFVAAYLLLLQRRDALLAPDGAARVFAGKPVRVLFRTTTQYGALQYVLTAPQYQRSGLRRSFALDSLNRCFAQDGDRPILWPLVADERRALERLDIPHFTVASDATIAHSGAGEPIEGYFRRSGFDAVLDRVRGLSEEDLTAQVDALRGALASSVDSRFQTAAPSGGRPGTVEDRLVEHAVWIGCELLAHAEEGDDLSWPSLGSAAGRHGWGPHHLYDGTAGPVLFMAALAAVTGEPAWADAARAAARPLARALDAGDRAGSAGDDDPLGVAGCLASVAYALGLSGELLGDDAFLELALGIGARVTPERIEADRALDVVGGAAGAALALTALHRLRGEGWLVERAAHSARRLLHAAVEPAPGALAWPAADGRLLAGFGHGAAGIALALVRVAEATGESGLADAARAAHRYERGLFAAPQRNWRIVGPNNFMAAWCHGAPGVGLSRALSLDTLDDGEVRAEIEAAMFTTLDAAPHGSDHLCCGRLGRADVLLTVGRRLGRPEWVDAARGTAVSVAERAARERRFAVPSTEFEYAVFHPGFFKGLSGIGYQLLRVAAPSRVPSVLGFQARDRSGEPR